MIATSFSLDFLCFVREKVIREHDKNHEKLKVPSKAKNEKEKTKKNTTTTKYDAIKNNHFVYYCDYKYYVDYVINE